MHLPFVFVSLIYCCGGWINLQTVFENSLMEHRVALPPDAMGKITYIAPAGQYSLKVCLKFYLENLIMLSITSIFFSAVYLHFICTLVIH